MKPQDWTGAEAAAKSNDTLDVWIDSGSSSRAVIETRRQELQHADKTGTKFWQADIYLEGSDQHRGWFQSSLLLSLAGNGAAPFKTVLTHGFMVDADREKISKSKQGAYEKPQTAEAYVKKYGADVVRLWVASQDYRSDIVVSEERINKVGETYRGIRNALRYQLSNLYDFDPAKHSVPDDKLTGLDRWILGEFCEARSRSHRRLRPIRISRRLSEIQPVHRRGTLVDLSRRHQGPALHRRREFAAPPFHANRAAPAGDRPVQMLSPILAFTADEAWEFVPGKKVNSVHESEFKPKHFKISDIEILDWSELFMLRDAVLPQLEVARRNKLIGKSLEAKVDLPVRKSYLFKIVEKNISDLCELLNVSALSVINHIEDDASKDDNLISAPEISRAAGEKCERCWHFETDIGQNAEHPTICGRCVEAVKQSTAH